MAVFEHVVIANTGASRFLADHVRVTTEQIGMEKLDAEQKPDSLAAKPRNEGKVRGYVRSDTLSA
jgi:hypothetical protein